MESMGRLSAEACRYFSRVWEGCLLDQGKLSVRCVEAFCTMWGGCCLVGLERLSGGCGETV